MSIGPREEGEEMTVHIRWGRDRVTGCPSLGTGSFPTVTVLRKTGREGVGREGEREV